MANFNFNKVILGGRIANDLELKKTPSGVSVTSFSLAVNRRHQKEGEAQADFINVTAWRNTAEFICQYFKKASSVCIVGSLQTRSWTDQQGNKRYATEVVAHEVTFCEAKKNSETNSTSPIQKTVQSEFGASGGYMPDAYKPSKSASEEFEPVDDASLPF
jgi:single-strand DNA-binding protein